MDDQSRTEWALRGAPRHPQAEITCGAGRHGAISRRRTAVKPLAWTLAIITVVGTPFMIYLTGTAQAVVGIITAACGLATMVLVGNIIPNRELAKAQQQTTKGE